MKNFRKLFIFLSLLPTMLFASVGGEPSSELLLKQLDLDLTIQFANDVIERGYRQNLDKIDQKIVENPHNVLIGIAKCDFIQDFTDQWGYEEGFDFLYEDSTECEESLDAKYAYHPEVKLRRLNYLYGEEFFTKAITEASSMPDAMWTAQQKARLYEQIAFRYAYEKPSAAIHYGEKALSLDSGSRIRLRLSSLHAQSNGIERAIEIAQYALIRLGELDSDDLELLLSIYANTGDKQRALLVYEKMRQEEGRNSLQVAQYLARVGLYNEARQAFRDLDDSSYGAEQLLFERFKFEFENGTKDSALHSYQRFRDGGLSVDPIGSNRIALFVKYPDLPWSLRDVGTVFMSVPIVLLTILVIAVPFCVIHYSAMVYSHRKNRALPMMGWGLSNAWSTLCCVYAGMIVPYLVLGPLDIMGDTLWYESELVEDRETVAMATLWGSIFTIGLLLPIARRWNVVDNQWFSDKQRIATAIFVGVAVGLAMRLPLGLALNYLPQVTEHFSRFTEQGIVISAVNQTYGWLATVWLLVIAAPVIEEFAFRGAILGGLQRYIPFWGANLIQASLFASLHTLESSLSVFYIFLLGVVLGLLRRKYEGLMVPIICHATFNGVFAYLFIV
ncbi:CPBP family intramembrane metalloprotease [Microbulbifer bruguierae]|uniref:CPBP family intramembrane metalloprotease n=1 Tax=Microbulbifer bruguierae TaxID=3029061 RepID=A0ABY8NAE2_9GAMM|nr:CPBP family intramembrane metalloprotease [Microbulbifer bruguierae]WGL15881.1 CPBP family intramembrane metalloprotease [Microbulbifer bruguierae]